VSGYEGLGTKYVLPKNPAKVRMVMRVDRFGLKAVGICNNVKRVKHVKYNTFRPKVSESGARISGPIPSMTTKPVWQPMTAFLDVLRDSAI
jgi:hypothetical protein